MMLRKETVLYSVRRWL